MTERSETQALIEEARAFIEENHDGGGDEGVFALLGRLVDALAASEARGERLAEAVTAFGALADAFDGDVPRLGGWSQPVDDDYEVKVSHVHRWRSS